MGDRAILGTGSAGEEVLELVLGGVRQPRVAAILREIHNEDRDPDA